MDGEVGESQARDALARVLASDALRNAPRLQAFLSYVGLRTLAGEGGALKGYTIATEALGRPADFDPQADPIVRVEAGRLRRALAAYYAGPGAADPVVVAIPLGRYVPTFRAVAPAVAEAPAPLAVERKPQPRRWLAPVATLALALTLGLSFAPLPEALSPAEPDRPVLLVEGEGDPSSRVRAATAEALAQFGDLTVLDGTRAPSGGTATYVLTLRTTDDGTLAAALRHRESGTIAWARRFAEAGPAPDRIAAAVGGWRGAQIADLGSHRGTPGSRCLAAAAALDSADPLRRRSARACLDRADASAALRARLAEDPAEALRLARAALAHEPDGSAALGALAAARLASGDVAGALAAALRATARNPADPLAAADLAAALLAAGRGAKAREAATRALLLDPRLAARPDLEAAAAGTGRLAAAATD